MGEYIYGKDGGCGRLRSEVIADRALLAKPAVATIF